MYVVNTCAVTNIAERKSRQVLSKIQKINKDAKIIVCGCASQNNPAKFLQNPNVFSVTGNAKKNEIMELINERNTTLPKIEDKIYTNNARPIETRTRQFIKIQDGCDYFCTYCLIPYVRGRSRSRDIDDILDEIKHTTSNEIVLTGINMTDYKIDGKLALKYLIKEVDKLNKRFRLSSIECMALDDEMIEILKNCKNFCPHLHISLQSACNETLRRMNRHYTIEQFMEKINKLRQQFPNICLSTDIIVGFKGETDEEFKTTYNNLKKIKFSFMHIFPYSVREGTVASRLKGDVDKQVVKQREQKLIELNKKFKEEFYNNNKNTIHKVLIEEVVDERFSLGYTDNYIYSKIDEPLKIGEIYNIELVDTYNNGMIGVRR